MKADELMIGNYVNIQCFDGSLITIRITGINHGIVYGDSGNGSHWANIKYVKPIPLTPEILEKNGFVIKKKLAQIGNFGDSPLIMWHFEDEPILRHFKHELEIHQNDTGKVHIHIPCEYVHQLQNALRLCGIDKTIEL